MKRQAVAALVLFVFLIVFCRHPAQPDPIPKILLPSLATSQALPVGAADAGLSMKNPAAVYCTDLGYAYQIVEQEDGSQNGVCHLPDGSSCSAWAFLRGQCGVEHSICARRGLGTAVRSDGGNPFSREYAVCVDSTGRALQSATEMADLMAKSTGGTPGLPFDLPLYGPERLPTAPPALSLAPISDISGAAPPSAFDWRDHDGENWITPIKDQGMCGSCWAFGAVGAVEAQYNIGTNNPDLDLDLAEQYLVTDCAVDAGNCRGGWYGEALAFIRDRGIPDEGCLPYGDGGADGCTYTPECGSICTYRTYPHCSDYQCSDRCATWSERRLQIQGFGSVGSDKTTIKQALIERGPLAVTVSTKGSFGADGIYRCSDNSSYNHIVVLVGYSDSSGGYWILKNSHGAGYGEGGYYKVAYDTCAVQSWPTAIQTYLDEPDVTLSPPGDTGQGASGEVVTYRPWLTNHTGETESFELGLSDNGWPASLSIQRTRALAHGESIRFSVQVTIPADAVEGDSDSVRVTAVGSSSEAEDASTFTTQAAIPAQVEVSPAAVESTQAPGAITAHALDLHNPTSTALLFTIHQALPTDAALLLSLNETGAAQLFLDGSGQGHHATCTADSCPQAGVWSPRGKAAEFDGLNDRVVTPVHIDQSSSSPGATMMAWVYPTNGSTDPQYVISGDDGGHDWSILSWLGYWHVTDGEVARRTGFHVDLNRWQHIVAAHDPARGQTRFYWNGQEYITPHINYDTNSHDIMVGDNPVWHNPFAGKIDEVQVYRRPLGAHEVREIYQGSTQAEWLSWDVWNGWVFGLETRTIQLTLDATGLQASTYPATVSVVSNDPDDSRVDVPVTLVVADPAPEIAVAPASLEGALLQGESLTRTLTISNVGTADLTFNLSTEEDLSAQVLDVYWITLDPESGTVGPGAEQAVQVVMDATDLPPDVYRARIRVYSNDPLAQALTVPLTMTVQAPVTEGTVQGVVTDIDTGAPLSATVSVVGGPESTETDAGGAYSLTLEAGSYTLQATAAGYLSQTAGVELRALAVSTQDFALRALEPEQTHLYLPIVIR